jgi:hypothetical protein
VNGELTADDDEGDGDVFENETRWMFVWADTKHVVMGDDWSDDDVDDEAEEDEADDEEEIGKTGVEIEAM